MRNLFDLGLLAADGSGTVYALDTLNPTEAWRDVRSLEIVGAGDVIIGGTAWTDDFSDWQKAFLQKQKRSISVDY